MVVVLCTLFSVLYPLRHRVIPMSSPGMTAQDAANGEPQSFERTMFLYRLNGILRTRRGVATGRRGEWRNKLLVKAYGEDEQAGEHTVYSVGEVGVS